MKLHAPFIQLPLLFDADVLAAEVAAIEESAWRPHPQGFAGNSMLPLVAVHGDAANEAFAGPMAPTPELQRCPQLQQVLAALQATVGRTRLMRLAGQSEVTRHVDQGYYWTERVRVHVPIVTQPTVRFECGDAAINMAAGECWIFDTWRQHRVLNDASASRIHLVVDTVGGGGFWQLVAKGRTHDAPLQHWSPQSPPQRVAVVAFESRNVPAVMTPWELSAHLAFLFDEALPHPQLPVLRQQAARLIQLWRGLWAQHGEAASGRASFRAAFDAFAAAVQPLSSEVVLGNQMRWFDVLMVMIARAAVSPAESQAADANRAAAPAGRT
ncbi:MAG: aspartyl/asparaginyl beta-hydroxylase domain-containing protein [Lysobacter sp.]|nr:aspartyl/asparaginyl beta-hydroxylase domain-containing protein [Lysobacter sp.]